MDDLRGLLVLVHVASALFMAAPLYMLIVVNERARLGAPLGVPHDAYLENIVRRQPIRCYAYLAVLSASGIWLALWNGVDGLGRPDVVATFAPATPAPDEAKRVLPTLRARRKRLAATCLFLVLVAATFGVRLLVALSPAATAVVILLALALAWRAHQTGVRYGYL